jgi:4-nitrophenyl phosphatase
MEMLLKDINQLARYDNAPFHKRNTLPAKVGALVLDMDGVLWRSLTPIGNLAEIFRCIKARRLEIVFATNNGTRTPEQYVDLLRGFGLEAETWQIVTSSLVLAHMLSRELPGGGSVYAIGEEGLIKALHEKNFATLSMDEADKADAVVIGMDRHISVKKFAEAALLVQKGIPFYATNPDKTFPTPRGKIPGAGSWISVISTATGISPVYAGKPSPALVDMACQRLGMPKESVLVVGDRLDTDIAAGQAAGCPVALVLSGVSSRMEAVAWRPRVDIIADDLESLVKV